MRNIFTFSVGTAPIHWCKQTTFLHIHDIIYWTEATLRADYRFAYNSCAIWYRKIHKKITNIIFEQLIITISEKQSKKLHRYNSQMCMTWLLELKHLKKKKQVDKGKRWRKKYGRGNFFFCIKSSQIYIHFYRKLKKGCPHHPHSNSF